MENQSIIINENLSSIIDKAQATQNYYENKKVSDRLKKANLNALIVESHLNDIYVLEQVLDKITTLQLESVTGANIDKAFSKKQTTKQFINDIKEQLKKEKDNSVINIKTNSSLVEDKVRIIIDCDYTTDDKNKIKYIEFNVVDACLYNYQRKIEEKLTNDLANLTTAEYKHESQQNANINLEFERLLNSKISKYKSKLGELSTLYPNIDISKLEDITDKLISLIIKENNNKKSIIMYKRFIVFISKNLKNGSKYQIIDKLKKEIRDLEQNNLKIANEIIKLEEELNLSKENTPKNKVVSPFISKTEIKINKIEQIEQLVRIKQKLEELQEGQALKTAEEKVVKTKRMLIRI